jgi:cellulose synthase/poly-beta-1,6-N-acetylglucosamine synthase-like glycosyltransferase
LTVTLRALEGRTRWQRGQLRAFLRSFHFYLSLHLNTLEVRQQIFAAEFKTTSTVAATIFVFFLQLSAAQTTTTVLPSQTHKLSSASNFAEIYSSP